MTPANPDAAPSGAWPSLEGRVWVRPAAGGPACWLHLDDARGMERDLRGARRLARGQKGQAAGQQVQPERGGSAFLEIHASAETGQVTLTLRPWSSDLKQIRRESQRTVLTPAETQRLADQVRDASRREILGQTQRQQTLSWAGLLMGALQGPEAGAPLSLTPEEAAQLSWDAPLERRGPRRHLRLTLQGARVLSHGPLQVLRPPPLPPEINPGWLSRAAQVPGWARLVGQPWLPLFSAYWEAPFEASAALNQALERLETDPRLRALTPLLVLSGELPSEADVARHAQACAEVLASCWPGGRT